MAQTSRNTRASKAKTVAEPPATIARGQVWFITEDPDRPAVGAEIWPDHYGVIVSADPIAANSGAVTVAYVTTSRSKVASVALSPTHVKCRMSGKDAVILCEQPTTVDKSRLERYSHTLRDSVMKKVDEALCVALQVSSVDCSAAFAKWEKHIRAGTSSVGEDGFDVDSFADDAARLARENTLLRAERDSYRVLLKIREEAADAKLDI